MRQTLGVGVWQRLERRDGLNAERLECVTELAGRLFIRLCAIAALLHHHADGHREQTGVCVQRQEEINHRQRDGDKLGTFHREQVTTYYGLSQALKGRRD